VVWCVHVVTAQARFFSFTPFKGKTLT
jgi:hypothetical protein